MPPDDDLDIVGATLAELRAAAEARADAEIEAIRAAREARRDS